MAKDQIKRIALPESLGPAEATELADQLRTLRGAPLEIEAHDVRRLGGLCVQVLLSALATWRADGLRLTLVEPSPEVEESLRLLGLSADALSVGEPA
jgi:chemotaxis protein CheX